MLLFKGCQTSDNKFNCKKLFVKNRKILIDIHKYMVDNNIMRETMFFFGAKTMEDLFLVDRIKGFEVFFAIANCNKMQCKSVTPLRYI